MTTVQTLPRGLKPESFERGGSIPGNRIPTVRFVPDDLDYKGRGGGKPQKIKITISGEISKEIHILFKGGMEDALKLLMTHFSLVCEKKYAERLDANQRLINTKNKEYDRLKTKSSESPDLVDLSEAITELQHGRKDLKNAMFELLGQMVSDNLRKKWEIIVARECDSPDFVNLDRKRQTVKRGRNLKSLEACYTHFLRLFGPQDSAERQKNYLQQLLWLSFDITNVGQCFFRVSEMNQCITWMPSLKNEENLPDEMPRIEPLNMCCWETWDLPM